MAEQEKKDQGKKQEKISFEEAFRRASKSLREKGPHTDFDELDSQMTEELVNKLHEGLRRNRK